MSGVRGARHSISLALCAIFLLADCGGTGCRRTITQSEDLLALVPFTPTRQETERIDFGTSLGDLYLLAGWSQTPPRGAPPLPESVSYLRRRAGKLFLHLAEPAQRTIALRCKAVRSSRIIAALRLNRTQIGRTAFGSEWTTASFEVPVHAQRAGVNELRILANVSAPTASPQAPAGEQEAATAGSALACDVLVVRATETPRSTRLFVGETGGYEAAVPPRASIELYVRLRQQTDLVLHASRGSGRLQVEQEDDSGSRRELFAGRADAAEARARLRGSPGEIVALRVRAAGDEGLTLDRLELEHREPAAQPHLPQPIAKRSLILYVVDTLRADRLGCYGYERPTSPSIDAFAAEAVVFEDAQAQASWTRPAVASMLTGLLPPRHGAVRLQFSLSPSVPTLAELLRREGYATAAFVTNMNVSPEWGFDRGFDVYDYVEEDDESESVYEPAHRAHRRARAWLESIGDRPFLLYVHVSDPHAPYTPSESTARRLGPVPPVPAGASRARPPRRDAPLSPDERRRWAEWLSALYDAEVADLDEAFGELIGAIRATGHLDRALMVFVADHGEEFFDHGGFSHGHTLYDEQLHVPLVLRFPGGEHGGRRVGRPVQQADVFATAADYTGLPALESTDGRSLLPLARGVDPDATAPLAFSHTWFDKNEIVSLIAPEWKVVIDRGARLRSGERPESFEEERVEVYDRARDRGESENVAARRPLVVGYARQVLAAMAARRPFEPAPERKIDSETLERLRALGYGSE